MYHVTALTHTRSSIKARLRVTSVELRTVVYRLRNRHNKSSVKARLFQPKSDPFRLTLAVPAFVERRLSDSMRCAVEYLLASTSPRTLRVSWEFDAAI